MKNLLVVVLLFLGFSNLLSQGISYNEEFQVNSYTYGNQENPDIAILNNKNIVICWTSYDRLKDEKDIVIKLLDNNGIVRKEDFIVNSDSYNYNDFPSICEISTGGFVIAWQSWKNDMNMWIILTQVFDSTGNKVGNEIVLSGQAQEPFIKCLDSGFIISWTSYGKDGFGFGISAKYFDNLGNPISDEIVLTTDQGTHQKKSKLNVLLNGDIIVCWNAYTAIDGSESGVYARIINSQSHLLDPIFQVNSYIQNKQEDPSITVLNSGEIVIIWQSKDQDGSDWGIFGQMFTVDGKKKGPEFQVNSRTENRQNSPEVIKLSNGNFIVAFETWVIPSSYGDVSLQIFDKSSNKIGRELFINEYFTDTQFEVAISEVANLGFLLSWSSSDQDGNGYGIFAKCYLYDPVNHNLSNFGLLEPKLDATVKDLNPLFKWYKGSTTHINFPWELTYDLYIDNDESFSNPLIISGIEDTTYQIDYLTPGNTYFWKVLARNILGDSLWSSNVNGFYIDPNATDVIEIESTMPEKFELFQNYPNPFNPTTNITYSLPVGQTNYHVVIKIYDVLGRLVTELVNTNQQPGNYQIEFSANELTSGIYFYFIQASEFYETKKMLLMR